MGKPLEGVKVVDLTYYVAGPGCARILADWGADVIKVEPPSGEPGRNTSLTLGMPATDDINPYFGVYNTNKRDIALNLKTEEGKDILNKMLSEANVFVTSFRPGALKRLGLDYEAMSEKHPHIIWASINGFGNYGPDKDNAGFDTVAFWARSGAMMDLVEKDTSPINPTLAFGDSVTSCSLSGGIAAALYKQAKTGEGSQVLVSLYGQALWCLSSVVASSQFGDTYPKSRLTPNTPMVNHYKTSEGKWTFTTVFDDRLYPLYLEKVVGRPDLAADERYNNPVGAKKYAEELTKIFEAAFAQITQEELISRLKAADIAYEKINHAGDAVTDEQALANKYIVEYTHRGGEKTMTTVPPVKFDTIDVDFRYDYPLVGEHTIEILKELGYDEEQIKKWNDSGVCFSR
ncbi:CoA transferase [Lachnospiraceae bacterium ZAX-1]